MLRLKIKFLLILGISFVWPLSLFAQTVDQTEDFVISTYYPSPHGSYEELKSGRMAIGPTYYRNSFVGWDVGVADIAWPDVSLLVEGKMGIGTKTPLYALDVQGHVIIDEGGKGDQPICWTLGQTLGHCTLFSRDGICITCWYLSDW